MRIYQIKLDNLSNKNFVNLSNEIFVKSQNENC